MQHCLISDLISIHYLLSLLLFSLYLLYTENFVRQILLLEAKPPV